LGLLFLRSGLGLAATMEAISLLESAQPANVAVWVLGLAAIASGALLLVGLLTPGAGAVAGACSLLLCFPSVPGAPSLDVARAALVATDAAAILLLGPGAFSIDARLFGRREIIIPHSSSSRGAA